MGVSERQQQIVSILSKSSYLTVEQLSSQLAVSKVTIRSDLTVLEQKGLLVRMHGGAMLSENKAFSREFTKTIGENRTEKIAIAKTAAEIVKQNSTVIIDSGSTTVNIAENLKGKGVTIITNSFPAFEAVLNDYSVEVLFSGGSLNRSTMGTIGPATVQFFSQVHADILFLGAAAFNNDGIYSSNLTEAEVKKSMIKASDIVCFAADMSKYRKSAFASVAVWEDIDIFITDRIDLQLRQMLESKGIQVIVAV